MSNLKYLLHSLVGTVEDVTDREKPGRQRQSSTFLVPSFWGARKGGKDIFLPQSMKMISRDTVDW